MQITRMLLARHAETAAPDRFHGAESDIGLSEFGVRQAGRLAQYMSTQGAAAVYSSAMRRAVDTAQPIAIACNVEPIPIASLHERRIGPLSGRSRDEGWAVYAESKTRWMDGDLDHTHEGGESYNDVRRRIVPVLEELSVRHAGETIVVIAHGVVIRVALTSLLADAHPSKFDRFAIDFASVNDLRFDGKTWMAHALNVVIAASDQRPVA